MRWLIAVLILIAIVAAAGYVLIFRSVAPVGGPVPQPAPSDSVHPSGAVITVHGTVTCLPHKNTGGAETTECAIGLQSDDGGFYGLLDLDQQDLISGVWTTGSKVTVSGVFSVPAQSNYAIRGVISVQSIVADDER